MAPTLKQRISELIGAPRRIRLRQINSTAPTRDFTTADYRYWDKARRAKARGLEISGLLLKPLASKTAAWTLGASLSWEAGSGMAGGALNAWWERHHPHIVRAYEEALNLGDYYLVVNADLSLTVVPPHVVEPLLDADGAVAGWRITETNDATTVVDEYTLTHRTRRTMRGGVSIRTEKYANLLGMLPVIHIANRTGSDEFYGRPEGDALIPALQRYGDLIDAAIRGNIRQGRPTPVIERMGTAEQVRKFWEQFGRRETQTLPDGTSEAVDVIDFDPDQLLTLGGEAQFRYAAPGSFSADTQTLLGILFYLVLQHSEIPEAVWGASIPSSRASAETQMQPFIQWIEKKRGLATGWLHELARVVLTYMALTDWRIDPTTSLHIQWTPLTDEDRRLRLDTVSWAHGAGVLDDAEARQALGI
jgi:hypothetical protein